jgi:hypothetical protein
MRRLSAVFASLLFCSVLQAQMPAGAGDPNAPAVTAITIKQQDPPQQVSNAAVQAIGAGGFRTLYYWVVSHSTVGVSAPAGPFVLNGGPNDISSGAQVTINWFPAPGVTSYDVLRTRTDDPPTGSCNCAVATGVTTTTATDQSDTLQAYTVSVFDSSSSGITLTNESYSQGVTALTARYKGQFMWQVRSDGSERRAGNYELDGSIKAKATVFGVVTKSGNYTLSLVDHTVLADTSGGSFTLTLMGNPVTGHELHIKLINSANTLTVSGNGKLIDGLSSWTLAVRDEALTIQYDGTVWRVL